MKCVCVVDVVRGQLQETHSSRYLTGCQWEKEPASYSQVDPWKTLKHANSPMLWATYSEEVNVCTWHVSLKFGEGEEGATSKDIEAGVCFSPRQEVARAGLSQAWIETMLLCAWEEADGDHHFRVLHLVEGAINHLQVSEQAPRCSR